MSITIKDTIIDEWEIKSERILACTADNCSTNLGRKNGVLKLLSSFFGAFLAIGCLAHKMQLFVAASLLYLVYFVALENIIFKLISYIRGASSRASSLKELCKLTNESNNNIKIIHKIRWLSRADVMQIIFNKIIAILKMLKNDKNSNNTAKWLYERMATVFFFGIFRKNIRRNNMLFTITTIFPR